MICGGRQNHLNVGSCREIHAPRTLPAIRTMADMAPPAREEIRVGDCDAEEPQGQFTFGTCAKEDGLCWFRSPVSLSMVMLSQMHLCVSRRVG